MGWLLAALGPAVIGWSLAGTANAAEEAEVGARLQDAWTASGGDLVVCAAGDEAEALVRRLLKDSETGIEPAVERIPVLGAVESEAERVRVEVGRGCAFWVRKEADEGGWTAGSVGPCTPPPAEPILPSVVATEPSLDADPGDVGPAPAPAPAPTAPQPIADGPWKLVMAELDPDPADVDGVRWHVVDERGVSWSTYRFAETVGDVEMVGTLDRELAVANKERKALFWGGIAAMAISPVPMLFSQPGTYERNQDLAWTSLFLAASGGMTFAIHKRGVQSTKRRQLRPAHYYSRADSEALIGAHNARVDVIRAAAEAAPPPSEGAAVEAPVEVDGTDEAAPAGDAPESPKADESGAPAAVPADDDAPAEPADGAEPDEAGDEAAPDEAGDEAAPGEAGDEAGPVEEGPPADEAGDAAPGPAEDSAPADSPVPVDASAPAPEAPVEAPPALEPDAPAAEPPAPDAPAEGGGAQ